MTSLTGNTSRTISTFIIYLIIIFNCFGPNSTVLQLKILFHINSLCSHFKFRCSISNWKLCSAQSRVAVDDTVKDARNSIYDAAFTVAVLNMKRS